MPTKNIIAKLKKSKLIGRSGSGFPTWLKWQTVKKAKAKEKFIICNGSEGEPNVFKDGFILENYPKEIVEGIRIALETIDNSSAFIYLRKDYYQKFKEKLKILIGDLPITIFKKRGGYLGGEETVLCEVIEGNKPEPRIKPPFPAESGLWGFPTLINNLETFYWVAKIAKEKYRKTRFYSIDGDVKNKGVYELPENWSISQILKKTKNWPDFDFFVQSGGGGAGEILLPKELNQPVKRIGGLIVYNRKKTNSFALMRKWTKFFLAENCDKCVPCREGVYRLAEMIEKEKIDKKILNDLFFVLEETSFCALGRGVVTPFKSLINKIVNE